MTKILYSRLLIRKGILRSSIMSWTRSGKKGYRRKGGVRVARTLLSANLEVFLDCRLVELQGRTRTRVSAPHRSPMRQPHSLAHHGGVLRPDFIHHANFSRLRVRILVDSHVLLSQLVDVLGGAVLAN